MKATGTVDTGGASTTLDVQSAGEVVNRALVVRGDARHLGFLPDGSVQCVCTSPPYFGLRDYQTGRWLGGDPKCQHRVMPGRGNDTDRKSGQSHASGANRGGKPRLCRCGAIREDRQIGLESAYSEFVAQMVAVGREVWRVLRDDGTWFLNLGDTFNTYKGNGLKEKDLMGVPWRVAFALQEFGFYLRCDVIWEKPSAVPDSTSDRFTRSHEYVFFFSKSARYYYDADAVREPLAKATLIRDNSSRIVKKGKSNVAVNGANFGVVHDHETVSNPLGRNCRTIWRIAHGGGFKGKHFAVMPLGLAERCLRAGTSERGACPDCRAPWVRVTRRIYAEVANSFGERDASCIDTRASKKPHVALEDVQTLGWRPSCKCYDDRYREIDRYARLTAFAGRLKRARRNKVLRLWRERNPAPRDWPTVPCLVLDPFGGAGTTAVAAELLGLRSVVTELSQDYCVMARERIDERSEFFARPHCKQQPAIPAGKRAPLPGQTSFLE